MEDHVANPATSQDETEGDGTSEESGARRITLFDVKESGSPPQPLSKRFSYPGGALKKHSPGTVVCANARVVNVETATALAAIINACDKWRALSIGILKDGARSAAIGVEGRLKEGEISRSKKNFDFPTAPGWMLIDVDAKKETPPQVVQDIRENGAVAAIKAFWPAIETAERVFRRSTSTGIRSPSGAVLTDSLGAHIYIAVKEAADIPRALEVLHKRAWLNGCGWISLAKNGAALERSVIDASVGSPERLIFEGAPILADGLTQDESDRRAEAFKGILIDTRRSIRDLKKDEEATYVAMVKNAKAAGLATDEAIALREAEMDRCGYDTPEKRAQFEALLKRDVLGPDMVLRFTNPAIGTVTVRDVLLDAASFHQEKLIDPLDDENGRSRAKLYLNSNGRIFIHSFKSGGRNYELVPDVDEEPNRIMVGGMEKQVTNIAELNERYAFLTVKGQPSAYVAKNDSMPIAPEDLKRRLDCEVVVVGQDKDGEPVTVEAVNYFKGDARRHVFTAVAFTREPQPPNVFNLYSGLGVTPAPGKIGLILKHIEEVLCAGDKDKANRLVKLMAWQLRNIGKPSRVIVLLRSEKHQVGKGIIIEQLLLPIYGPSGASITMGNIDGPFNDIIRGKGFVLMDEALFSGNRKGADIIKTLSTAASTAINAKYLSALMLPIAVNLWLLSNHVDAAHIEEHDVRYVVLEVSDCRKGDFEYFRALRAEIENGGREAFAHHLLNIDVSDFIPARDAPASSALKKTMIKESVNHLDIRHWMEECFTTETLVGHAEMQIVVGCAEPQLVQNVEYVAGAVYKYSDLHLAYKNWQQRAKGPKAGTPTPTNRIGEMLSRAGFETKRDSDGGRLRVLPDPAAALATLWDPEPKADEPNATLAQENESPFPWKRQK